MTRVFFYCIAVERNTLVHREPPTNPSVTGRPANKRPSTCPTAYGKREITGLCELNGALTSEERLSAAASGILQRTESVGLLCGNSMYMPCTSDLLFLRLWRFVRLVFSIISVFSMRLCSSTPAASTIPFSYLSFSWNGYPSCIKGASLSNGCRKG